MRDLARLALRKGKQHLDGRRARVYSRIRENQLNPRESDITRGERQQDVHRGARAEADEPGHARRLPLMGDDLVKPLATDLSTVQFVELGWRRFRAGASHTLHCRLGGAPTSFGYLLPDATTSAA